MKPYQFLHTVAQALVSELTTGCAHIGSFAGLGFLAWYLSGKIRVFDRRGHVAKLCLVFFPLLLAALVGVSRVDDYWHHWQDVFAGGLLGISYAILDILGFFLCGLCVCFLVLIICGCSTMQG